jgi:hypothetical protein
VFIDSKDDVVSYMEGNGLGGVLLDLSSSRHVRQRLVERLEEMLGLHRTDLETRRVKNDDGSSEYSHYMWESIGDHYASPDDTHQRAVQGEYLHLVFEDPDLPAVRLAQPRVDGAALSPTDLYIFSFPSIESVYVLTHESYGPFLVR